jgi:hypothetical protein
MFYKLSPVYVLLGQSSPSVHVLPYAIVFPFHILKILLHSQTHPNSSYFLYLHPVVPEGKSFFHNHSFPPIYDDTKQNKT